MLKNQIILSFRRLLKNKTYSLITISGMAIGIACCLMIMTYISHELNYDTFHPFADRTYRVILGGSHTGPELLAPYLENNFPEVESVLRIEDNSRRLTLFGSANSYFYEENFYSADPSFFQIFGFVLEQGDPKTALNDPNSIIISKAVANKYFGNENPIDKILNLEKRKNYIISGVFKRINQPSHLSIDFLTSFKTLGVRKWNIFSCNTYLVLKKDTDIEKFKSKVINAYKTYSKAAGTNYSFSSIDFQPVRQINLSAATDSEPFKGNPKLYITLFSIVAFIILIIACMNYVNLSIADLINRSREVGVRKVVGANQIQLIRQSIIESLMIITIAALLALLIMEASQPVLNNIMGQSISIHNIHRLSIFAIGLLLVIFTISITTIYIAVMFTASKPAEILKNSANRGMKGMYIKRGLLGFQFIATITLIIISIVIMRQLHFMNSKELGFNKENILVIEDRVDVTDKHSKTLLNKIKKIPTVINAGYGELPYSIERDDLYEKPYFGTRYGNLRLRELEVGVGYLETLNIRIIEGRGFSSNGQSNVGSNVILINEAAVKQFGWVNPVGSLTMIGNKSYEIIGVFEDIHLGSLYEFIWPTMLEYRDYNNTLFIHIKPGNMRNTIAELENIWRQFAPYAPMHYYFLGEKINAIYNHDRRMGSLLLVFTILTLLITCTGLYGMISYIANQRTKEIGIRKVLGASILQVFNLLLREFCIIVLIAGIVAAPIASYMMNRWLQNFAYRIDLTIWPFLLAGFAALIIALLTISWQAIRAATANPVEALRYE